MNKKGFANIILVIIVVIFVGLVGYFAFVRKPEPPPATQIPPINETTVKEVVIGVLEAKQNRNFENAKPFLSSEFTKTIDPVGFAGTSNPHTGRFEIQDVQLFPDGGTYRINARVYQEYTGEGDIGYNDNSYYVKLFGDRYLIDNIEYGEYIELPKDETADRKTYQEEEIFSCLLSGEINKTQPYEQGVLVFKAKEGISEEAILSEIKKLEISVKTVNSAWGYSGIDRSTLFTEHSITPDKAKELIEIIVNRYEPQDIQASFSGLDHSTVNILFKHLLQINEQASINEQLSNLKSQGKLDSFSWNISPKQLYGFLPVPVGREEEFIEKLKKLEIFDCISRKLNVVPVKMPTPR